jgi:N-terminal acetyltransferase B complex non-catalytic subunit
MSSLQCTSCYQLCGAYCKCCLENLAHSALQSYRKAVNDDDTITKTLLPTDRHPADDLVILSAMCLIKLSLVHKNATQSIDDIKTSYILQAAVILEYAWLHSKPNFQISLLLIRLYSMLGAGSLAMRAFQRVGAKQIQLDTLSYTLYDRISSLHPHPFSNNIHGASLFPSPVEHLERHQNFYRKIRDHVNRNRWTSLEHGSYNSIFQINEFEDKINRSMSAVMSVVESRKIARLMQPGVPLAASSGGYDIFSKSIFSVPGIR